MKKLWLALILAGVTALFSCSLGAPAQTEPDALTSLRERLTSEGCELAVAYIGYYDGGIDGVEEYLSRLGILERFEFLKGLGQESFAQLAGGELYLVLPSEKDAEISVRRWYIDESDGYLGHIDESEEAVFQSNSGGPIVIRCNVSDIMPNSRILCGELSYSPMLSGRDSTLVIPEGVGVLDITPYDLLGILPEEPIE